ncbi:UNVERIFIED_CONTAM: hypothetical protein K2H54_004363 [Gekko kuhli]
MAANRGSQKNIRKILAVLDRSETFREEDNPSVAAKAPGPRRVDMPPDEDWRQNSYIPQPGARRRLPMHLTSVTYSSTSEAHREMLARVVAASVPPGSGW